MSDEEDKRIEEREEEEEEDYVDGEDEEENEEEEEDEDDEDYGKRRKSKKKGTKRGHEGGSGSKRKRKKKRSMFVDMEAEEDDDEDEEEEEVSEEALAAARAEKEQIPLRRRGSSWLDKDEKEIERDLLLKQRRLDAAEAAAAAAPDTEAARALRRSKNLPSVNDPSLFAVRCKPGKELEVVLQLLQKKQFSSVSVPIYSAVYTPQAKGFVYVEASSERTVQIALTDIPSAYPFTKVGAEIKNITVVPVKERPDVLTVTEARRPRTAGSSGRGAGGHGGDDDYDSEGGGGGGGEGDDDDDEGRECVLGASGERLHNGDWVRVTRGPYKGDLAQIVALVADKSTADVRLVPRFDLVALLAGEQEKARRYADRGDPDAAKKTREAVRAAAAAARSYAGRPPPRLFTKEDLQSAVDTLNRTLPRDVPAAKIGDFLMYSGNGGSRNMMLCGKYIIKDGGFIVREGVKSTSLDGVNVNPLPEEIQRFQVAENHSNSGGDDGVGDGSSGSGDGSGSGASGLAALASTIAKRQNEFVAGDPCRVAEGEMAGVTGTVVSADGQRVVVRPDKTSGLTAPFTTEHGLLEKHFRPGDHVRVMRGKMAGETGFVLVVRRDASAAGAPSVATLRTDSTERTVSVFVADLQISNEVASTTASRGGYYLYDLVQLPSRALGVVVAIGRESFTLLDTANITHELRLQEMGPRRSSVSGAFARRGGIGGIGARGARGGGGFVESGLDKYQRSLGVGDQVDVADGPHRGVHGVVKHFARQCAFIQSKEIFTNGGILAINASSLVLAGADRPAANPAPAYGSSSSSSGGYGGSGGGYGRRPFFRRGQTVRVRAGKYRGYVATVRNLTGSGAQIEIQANSRLVNVRGDEIEPEDGGSGRGGGYGGSSSSSSYGSGSGDSGDSWGWGTRGELPPPTPSHLLATPMREDVTATPSHSSAGAADSWGAFYSNTPRSDYDATPSADTPAAATPMVRAPGSSSSGGSGGSGGADYPATPEGYGYGDSAATPYTPGMPAQTPGGYGMSAPTPGYSLGVSTPAAMPTPAAPQHGGYASSDHPW